MMSNILKELRVQKGLKQREIADEVRITTSYYGMIEQGVRTPSLEIAKRIAELFSKDISDIFILSRKEEIEE